VLGGSFTNQGTIAAIPGAALSIQASRFVQTAGALRSAGDVAIPNLLVISGGSAALGSISGNSGTTVLGNVAAGPSVPMTVGSITQNSLTIHNTGVLKVSISTNRVTSIVNALTIDAGGLMDLGNKGLLLGNVATPESAVRQYLSNGYNANAATGIGDWNGRGGITSADAIASHNGPSPDFRISVGYVNGAYRNDPLINGPIPGQETLGTNRILVRPALYGDLNLDGKVDDTDLAIFSGLGQYNRPNPKFGWLGGDLNHDGKVDDVDLLIFSGTGNYNGPGYGSAAAAPALTTPGIIGDGELEFIYDPSTGHLKILYDGDPRITAEHPLQIIRMNSAAGIFRPENFNASGFSYVTTDAHTLDGSILGGGSLPDGYDLGAILPTGLNSRDLPNYLTIGWNVFGGGITLIQAFPEPGALALVGPGALALLSQRRRRRAGPRSREAPGGNTPPAASDARTPNRRLMKIKQ
jgi:hypothetical protein